MKQDAGMVVLVGDCARFSMVSIACSYSAGNKTVLFAV